ncbi:adenine DNA glycosylase [Sideroxyarcus emersonii]|uniref:Adenine DNA glycosylase n=1 Tax=Sideroxyarcus emersonii TaxID=2764705 RepID=A0AAN1X7W0_9PROT|nr:A/G-specific adenine glycosylase [Sideroxyarcus emersonii]BCK86562.1 adenine DNA glycosylase [Sideroxyarcus emersonii]
MSSFAHQLIRWQKQHGRHHLPWQGADAYRVWLSEIMLQQTQVATVIPYYQRFVAAFPDVAALAAASEDDVLAHWSGLGYYARGRNLHKAARIVVEKFDSAFPRKFDDIVELPGVGRSTAAAVCALAYHERRAILDGNVKRVLARYCGIEGWAGDKKVEERLWQQAEALLPESDIATYTQALMDMGATVCTRIKPKCVLCPVQADCVALATDRVAALPTPRPRKAVPERHAVFLLLMHGNDILLEKRPSSGIWGGLWCPPQFEDETAAREWFIRQELEASAGERLEEFSHTFTHFRLHITPLKVQLAHKPLRAAQPGAMWLEVEEALGAAIPTPVRKVLSVLSPLLSNQHQNRRG